MRPPRHQYSYAEYLYFEHYVSRFIKHEYVNGDILAMTGGSPDHSIIAANIIHRLKSQLDGKPCRVFTADLKIRIAAPNVSTYPDVSVVCGPPELDPEDAKGYTILNPIVLVEALSPSTGAYVCGEKLDYYKMIPSVREVLLVDQPVQRMAVWRRTDDDWSVEEVHEGAVKLVSIGCELSIADVYRDLLGST